MFSVVFCFFFLLLRAPPGSTLFPYTTLFRSQDLELWRLLRRLGFDLDLLGGRRRGDQRGDRKSTRLNSSHPSISYAVFCLKKKIIHLLSAKIVILKFIISVICSTSLLSFFYY